MSTPFRSTLPSVTSLKRSIREATVDLPLPVPPIIAVVCPRLQAKLSFLKVYSSASAKRKATRSNLRTSPAFWLSFTGSETLSAIVGEKSSTTRMRSQHSNALGRVRMTICAIIR